jgi:hypothetical protein
MQKPQNGRSGTIGYIHEMLGQLRMMAEDERCDMLAYLIEMAYVESGDVLRGDRPLERIIASRSR